MAENALGAVVASYAVIAEFSMFSVIKVDLEIDVVAEFSAFFVIKVLSSCAFLEWVYFSIIPKEVDFEDINAMREV